MFAYIKLTCAAVTGAISNTDPPCSTLFGKLTWFSRSVSISEIGHCISCFPDLSTQMLLGIACKFERIHQKLVLITSNNFQLICLS